MPVLGPFGNTLTRVGEDPRDFAGNFYTGLIQPEIALEAIAPSAEALSALCQAAFFVPPRWYCGALRAVSLLRKAARYVVAAGECLDT